jgi:hypothetical protein
MASVLMTVPSVFAEAGFATGTGGSGSFAVVGCGDSGFLFHIIFFLASPVRDTYEIAVLDRDAKHCSSLIEKETRGLRAWCSLK